MTAVAEHPARTGGLVALAAILIVAAGAYLTRGSASAVTTSRNLVARDSQFVNGPKAGATFAAISERMLGDAKHCAAAHGANDPRCLARYQVAAYTSVTAVELLNCTAPGVFQARQALYTELGAIAAIDRRPAYSARPPAVPGVPSC